LLTRSHLADKASAYAAAGCDGNGISLARASYWGSKSPAARIRNKVAWNPGGRVRSGHTHPTQLSQRLRGPFHVLVRQRGDQRFGAVLEKRRDFVDAIEGKGPVAAQEHRHPRRRARGSGRKPMFHDAAFEEQDGDPSPHDLVGAHGDRRYHSRGP